MAWPHSRSLTPQVAVRSHVSPRAATAPGTFPPLPAALGGPQPGGGAAECAGATDRWAGRAHGRERTTRGRAWAPGEVEGPLPAAPRRRCCSLRGMEGTATAVCEVMPGGERNRKGHCEETGFVREEAADLGQRGLALPEVEQEGRE